MLYIVRRTQLYLEDDVWQTLRLLAKTQSTTISDLVRQAVRDRYLGNKEKRRKAMMAFLGSRKHRTDMGDTEKYIRNLRRDRRIDDLDRK